MAFFRLLESISEFYSAGTETPEKSAFKLRGVGLCRYIPRAGISAVQVD